jgi:major membrane immunogen (membrane-anchored lipoprotein)
MKKLSKLLLVLVMVVVLTAACTKKGYKPGTYSGSAPDVYGGQENTATAVIVINDEGKIASVSLDTTYTTQDGTKTTKKALGYDYKMKELDPESSGEWFEQVKALEDKIVEKNGIDFLKTNNDGVTDAVTGCTIKIDALEKALKDALDKAK